MENTFWRKQSAGEPLFPDLIWSKPQNKQSAGKLLIIGGHKNEFARVAGCFSTAGKAGAGSIKVLLPESLRKIAQMIPDVEFAPANSSGSFASTALSEILDLAAWSDHVLLAGDLGKNSETTAMIDKFLVQPNTPITISLDSLQSIGITLDKILDLPVNLIIDRKTLQNIGIAAKLQTPIKSTTPALQLAEIIHGISNDAQANLVVQDENQTWVAVGGRLVTTPAKTVDNSELAATCAVWHMQNPTKPLEALTTASRG